MVSVDTHDLPPAASYLAGEHVDLRESLGLLVKPAAQMRAEAREERERVLSRLREHGLIGENPSERECVEAMHAYIVRTSAPLLQVSLVNAVGERRAQNQPGTDQSTQTGGFHLQTVLRRSSSSRIWPRIHASCRSFRL